MSNELSITISGPTKSGKTSLGIYLQQVLRGKGFRVELHDVDVLEVVGSDPVTAYLRTPRVVSQLGPTTKVNIQTITTKRKRR